MSDTTGNIFEIHRFSLNDGPGIRTTIFFKGCSLSCAWCHNYESQHDQRQLYFDAQKCTNCGNCVSVCPSNTHSILDGHHKVDYNVCDLSADCIEVCPSDALKIIGHSYTVDQLIDEVVKDRSYFDKSGGGVTLSGGEPMHQFGFLLTLTKALKNLGVHVCLDTSGYASKRLFTELMPTIDLFHYDIKSFDTRLHKQYTGVNNALILDNLRFLASQGKSIILRCPIIPGVNNDKEHFRKLGELASQYESIMQIDLLPYHNMGIKKACNLRQNENPPVFEVSEEEEKSHWKELINRYTQTRVNIGGL